jgi:hypothetical protein
MPKPTLRLEYHAPNARKKIRVRNVTSTELDRLRHLELITREQHDAGEAALRDLWMAKMLGPVAMNFSGGGGGGSGDPAPMSSSRSRGIKAVNEWIRELDADVGMGPRKVLMTLLCDDRFLDSPSTIVVIRQALSSTMKIHEARRHNRPTIVERFRQAFGSSGNES